MLGENSKDRCDVGMRDPDNRAESWGSAGQHTAPERVVTAGMWSFRRCYQEEVYMLRSKQRVCKLRAELQHLRLQSWGRCET